MKYAEFLTPARLWEKEAGAADSKNLRCRLCAHYCLIHPDGNGICRVRFNNDGVLMTSVGDKIAALNLDPVEKKPLYHFMPGTKTFSIGGLGCNFKCKFCQNSGISQAPDSLQWQLRTLEGAKKAIPAQLVKSARQSGAASISYTYNEPTVFFELMQDTSVQALEQGLRNIMVSNAYLSGECFNALKDLIQVANFDLKSFSKEFYRDLCGAKLEHVQRTLRLAVKAGWLVELTTLVIGGVNDSQAELEALARFIHEELGPETPWHVSRFHPAYQMQDLPATPLESLERALEAGKKQGLKYVYVGNVPGHESENTFCPSCGALVVERTGYDITVHGRGQCPACGHGIAGVWE